MSEDRAPAPWTVHHNDDAYWVEDRTGQKFAFIYFRDRAVVGTGSGAWLSRDLARRIATQIAKLPALLGAGSQPKASP